MNPAVIYVFLAVAKGFTCQALAAYCVERAPSRCSGGLQRVTASCADDHFGCDIWCYPPKGDQASSETSDGTANENGDTDGTETGNGDTADTGDTGGTGDTGDTGDTGGGEEPEGAGGDDESGE
jgi:hypothetical protein